MADAFCQDVEWYAQAHRHKDPQHLDPRQITEYKCKGFQHDPDERRPIQTEARNVSSEEGIHGAQVVGYVMPHVEMLRYGTVLNGKCDGQRDDKGRNRQIRSDVSGSAEVNHDTG